MKRTLPADAVDADVIFDGSPMASVNFPLALQLLFYVFLSVATFCYVSARGWPVPIWVWWGVGALLLGRLAYAMLLTATTRILITRARVRFSYGLITRKVASVELFRIQNIKSESPWWQTLLGFGSLVLETSDAWHPLWRLPGIPLSEELRDQLNEIAMHSRVSRGVGEVNIGRL